MSYWQIGADDARKGLQPITPDFPNHDVMIHSYLNGWLFAKEQMRAEA